MVISFTVSVGFLPLRALGRRERGQPDPPAAQGEYVGFPLGWAARELHALREKRLPEGRDFPLGNLDDEHRLRREGPGLVGGGHVLHAVHLLPNFTAPSIGGFPLRST